MNTYVVLRRGSWRTADGLNEANERSRIEAERMADEVRRIRSYVLAEPDGSIGSVCIYQAPSPETIRAHAARAGLPVDEIVAVTEVVVVRPDPVEAAA